MRVAGVLADAVLPARLRLEGARAAARRAFATGQFVPHGFAAPGGAAGEQFGAADRDHVLRIGRPARGDAAIAALVRPGITGGDREGLALRNRLLEDVVVFGHAAGFGAGFATTDGDVDDLDQVVRHGPVEVGCEIRIGQGRRVVQIDGLDAAGDADDVLSVQIPFAIAAGIGAAAVHLDDVQRDAAVAVL